MSRPRVYATPRSSTGVRFPVEMLERLHAAAGERGLSTNYLVVKAVEEFLDRLIPIDELRLTRDRAPSNGSDRPVSFTPDVDASGGGAE